MLLTAPVLGLAPTVTTLGAGAGPTVWASCAAWATVEGVVGAAIDSWARSTGWFEARTCVEHGRCNC